MDAVSLFADPWGATLLQRLADEVNTSGTLFVLLLQRKFTVPEISRKASAFAVDKRRRRERTQSLTNYDGFFGFLLRKGQFFGCQGPLKDYKQQSLVT